MVDHQLKSKDIDYAQMETSKVDISNNNEGIDILSYGNPSQVVRPGWQCLTDHPSFIWGISRKYGVWCHRVSGRSPTGIGNQLIGDYGEVGTHLTRNEGKWNGISR